MSMITFKTFWNLDEASEALQILKNNDVRSRIEKLNNNSISQLTNTGVEQYILLIDESNIEKANGILKSYIGQIDLTEHPFIDYSNDELLDILKKQDKWDSDEPEVAKALLKQRDVKIEENDILKWKEDRLNELRKPTSGNILIIIAGFVFSTIGIYTFWGFGLLCLLIYGFGLAIGFNYFLHKKKLPQGEFVWNYTKNTRYIGMTIIVFNVLCVFFGLIMFL